MPRGGWLAVVMLAGALFAAVVSTTVVSVALPTIGRDLHAGPTQLSWIVDAYVLVYASLLAAGGALGDRHGRKGLFLLGVATFDAGALVTAIAPTIGGCWSAGATGCRARAAGAGEPDDHPSHVRGPAAARGRDRPVVDQFRLALAVGPALGGVIVDDLGWRWVGSSRASGARRFASGSTGSILTTGAMACGTHPGRSTRRYASPCPGDLPGWTDLARRCYTGYRILYAICEAVMSDLHAQPTARFVRDVYGRSYRVGESDRGLTGHSRGWMLATAWLAMLTVSATQYGYGVIIPVLAGTNGWRLERTFMLLPVWALSQAVAVVVLTWRRHRGTSGPRWTVPLGAMLCAAGLLTLAHASDFLLVVLGYGVVGGVGAGLVYGTCLGVIARWYPDQPARVGVVSGAFAYGSIPLVLVVGLVSGHGHISLVLDVAGLLVLVAGVAAGVVLADPPPHWWPAHLDPQVWAVDKSVNRGLRRNRPAIRSYSPGEVLHCPVAWLMYLVVICASAVALFDAAYLAVFAMESGWGGGYAAIAVAVLAAGSGLARSPAGRACDRFGRDRVVRAALSVGGVAQLLLLSGGEHRMPALLLIGAGLAGASSGVCYALLPGLVGAYFGDDNGLVNFGVLYSAKAVGAVFGVGLAAFVVFPDGYRVGFAVAALLSVADAVVLRSLRRPGLPLSFLPSPLDITRGSVHHVGYLIRYAVYRDAT